MKFAGKYSFYAYSILPWLLSHLKDLRLNTLFMNILDILCME